jgi:hypothetical protein
MLEAIARIEVAARIQVFARIDEVQVASPLPGRSQPARFDDLRGAAAIGRHCRARPSAQLSTARAFQRAGLRRSRRYRQAWPQSRPASLPLSECRSALGELRRLRGCCIWVDAEAAGAAHRCRRGPSVRRHILGMRDALGASASRPTRQPRLVGTEQAPIPPFAEKQGSRSDHSRRCAPPAGPVAQVAKLGSQPILAKRPLAARKRAGDPSRGTRWLVHPAEEKRVFWTDRHDDRRADEAAGLAAGEQEVCGRRAGRDPLSFLTSTGQCTTPDVSHRLIPSGRCRAKAVGRSEVCLARTLRSEV